MRQGEDQIWPPAPVIRGLKMAVVDHPLRFTRPATTSRDTLHEKPTWFLVVEDGDGRIGVGECSLIPGLSPETSLQAEAELNRIASTGVLDAMSVPATCPAVRFCVEMAAWDLHHGGQGIVGPSSFTRAEATIDINGLVWMASVADMERQFRSLIDQGYTTLKCKVGHHDWQDELSLLQKLRKEFPSLTFRVDANGAWSLGSLSEAKAKLEALAQIDIHSIEQPLHPEDRAGLAELCASNILPIALDESLIGVTDLVQRVKLLDEIQPQYLVLKPSLIGGIDGATVWSQLAKQRDINWWATSALESNVGLSAIAQWVGSQVNDLPQGLGTGGLFDNNVPGTTEVVQGRLTWTGGVGNEGWRPWVRDAVSHDSGCGCGLHTPKGQITCGNQSWPASAIGAKEFQRTQSRKAPWRSDVAEVWRRWCLEEEPGMEVETSGSTGEPKRIVHSRQAVKSSAWDTIRHFGLTPGTRAVSALPANFVAGQAMIIRALLGQWSLHLMEPTSIPSWEGYMDFVALTPHQAWGWVQQGHGQTNTLLLGGGPLSTPLVSALLESGRVQEIWEGFGMSETITHVALRKIDHPDDLNRAFHPLPGIVIGTNEHGCAVIHAPDREVLHFETTDQIEELDNGGFVWLGRQDDVMNSGGVLIHPSELERAFEQWMPGWVSDWVAFARPDDMLGDAVIFRVDGTPPDHVDLPSLSEEWRKHFKSTLGAKKAPRLIEFKPIPRTERGKIKRQEL